EPLDIRVARRVGPDRPGQLADSIRRERGRDSGARPIELVGPARELPAEGRWLCVNAVRSADADGVPMLFGTRGHECRRALDSLDDEPARVLDLERQRRVDDVRRGEPEVDAEPLWAELLRN